MYHCLVLTSVIVLIAGSPAPRLARSLGGPAAPRRSRAIFIRRGPPALHSSKLRRRLAEALAKAAAPRLNRP